MIQYFKSNFFNIFIKISLGKSIFILSLIISYYFSAEYDFISHTSCLIDLYINDYLFF